MTQPTESEANGMEMGATEAQKAARATWSAGDFDAVADRIWSVGERVVGAAAVNPGEAVLDVACGSGNAAIRAAMAGGRVTGLDITPELFDAGRRRAAAAGVEVEFVEGDAQELPFEDASFDVVVSTFGCMFAPDHRRTAQGIARVLRPGGRMAIASWNPAGGIGDFFAAIATVLPPPAADFQPPPNWGLRDHVTEIFAGTGVELRFEDAAVTFEFESVDEAVQEYGDKFGPVVVLRRALEAEGRWPELRGALEEFFERANRADGEGLVFDGEYLIALGSKPEG